MLLLFTTMLLDECTGDATRLFAGAARRRLGMPISATTKMTRDAVWVLSELLVLATSRKFDDGEESERAASARDRAEEAEHRQDEDDEEDRAEHQQKADPAILDDVHVLVGLQQEIDLGEVDAVEQIVRAQIVEQLEHIEARLRAGVELGELDDALAEHGA